MLGFFTAGASKLMALGTLAFGFMGGAYVTGESNAKVAHAVASGQGSAMPDVHMTSNPQTTFKTDASPQVTVSPNNNVHYASSQQFAPSVTLITNYNAGADGKPNPVLPLVPDCSINQSSGAQTSNNNQLSERKDTTAPVQSNPVLHEKIIQPPLHYGSSSFISYKAITIVAATCIAVRLYIYLCNMDIYLAETHHWFNWHQELTPHDLEQLTHDDLVTFLSQRINNKKLVINGVDDSKNLYTKIANEIEQERKIIAHYVSVVTYAGTSERLKHGQRLHERLHILKNIFDVGIEMPGTTKSRVVV